MIRALFVRARMNKSKRLKIKLWSECAHMVTQMHNILVNDPKDQCPFEMFYDKLLKWIKVAKLKLFGWMGIIKSYSKIESKLANRGKIGVMVGYGDGHAAGTYHMFILATKRVVLSQDIRWIVMYYST